MQTRKRAKPVKFGKTKEKEPEEVEVKEEEKASPAAEEITRENIAESIEEAHEDDEPEAISLSAPTEEKEEIDDDDKESFDKHSVELTPKPQDKKEVNSAESSDEDETIEKEEERPEVREEEKTEPEEHEKQTTSAFGSFTKQNEPKEKKGSLGFFIMVVIIAFLIGLGGMVGFTYFKDADLMKKVTELTASPTPTPRPTKAPTPTTKAVNKEENTIKVMNGSGISGLAAESKSDLEAAGFTVASIGNADNSDYTSTIIAAKKSVDEAYLTELTKELEKSYEVEIAAKTLPDSAGTDIEITLGSTTAE